MREKVLQLSYELAWRTESDERFLKSSEWRKLLRPRILVRDDYTCTYCRYRGEKGMQVNHVNGNPKDNSSENLEVICADCHKISHSGLWCTVFDVVDVYEKSKYSQNEIIRLTRKMRRQGVSDREIISYLGLEQLVGWKQDLEYLKDKYGFITSRPVVRRGSKPLLTENEQKNALDSARACRRTLSLEAVDPS